MALLLGERAPESRQVEPNAGDHRGPLKLHFVHDLDIRLRAQAGSHILMYPSLSSTTHPHRHADFVLTHCVRQASSIFAVKRFARYFLSQ